MRPILLFLRKSTDYSNNLFFYRQQKTPPFGGVFTVKENYLIESLKVLPALKEGDLLAAILIFKVGFCGLTPIRAFL